MQDFLNKNLNVVITAVVALCIIVLLTIMLILSKISLNLTEKRCNKKIAVIEKDISNQLASNKVDYDKLVLERNQLLLDLNVLQNTCVDYVKSVHKTKTEFEKALTIIQEMRDENLKLRTPTLNKQKVIVELVQRIKGGNNRS